MAYDLIMTIFNNPQWVIAAGTLAAVVVALFKEELQVWRRPKLTAKITLAPPDCHKTEMTLRNPSSGQVINKWECYYFRLWVKNQRGQRAEQVQVFAEKLFKEHADGKFRPETSFLPMNLRWSHSPDPEHPEIFAQGMSRHMGRHCDLGHIFEPTFRSSGHCPTLPNIPSNETILELDTEVAPNTLSHLLARGTYELHLRIAAANSKPRLTRLRIHLTGSWFSDEKKMFSDGIGVTEL